MYHGILPRQEGYGNLDLGIVYADQFDRHLRALKKRFQVLHPEDFADRVERGQEAPRRSVLVTLDDGFQNLLDYALPVSEAHGVVPLAFVSSGHLSGGDWLWFARILASRITGGPDLRGLFPKLAGMPIREIDPLVDASGAPTRDRGTPLSRMMFDGADATALAGHVRRGVLVLGGHTVRHPNLPREEADVRRREIGDNKRDLEALAGRPVRLFAYPTGDLDASVARDTRDAGYVAAFSIHPPPPGFPAELARFHLPRVGIYSAGWLQFRLKCAGIDRWRHRVGWLR
jgi:hypothetical protein